MHVCRCKANQFSVGMFRKPHCEQFIIPNIVAKAQHHTPAKHDEAEPEQEESRDLPARAFLFLFHIFSFIAAILSVFKDIGPAKCLHSSGTRFYFFWSSCTFQPLHILTDFAAQCKVLFYYFCSSSTRISFVRISLQIWSINSCRGFTPSSPAKRLLTDTVLSSASCAPTTSI